MNDIVLQGLGLLVLSAPFAFLWYVPSDKTAFRFGRATAWAGMAALQAALAAGFSLLHMVYPDGRSVLFPGTLYMAGTLMLGFAAYWLTVQDAAAKKIITFGISVVGGMTEYTLTSLFLYHLLPFYSKYATESCMFTLPGVICYFALDLLVVPPMAIFFHKGLREYFSDMPLEKINRHLPFFTSATFLYLAATFAIGANDSYENAADNLPIRLILFASSILCVFEAYHFLFWEIRQGDKRNEFRHLLNVQRLQLERLTSDIENAKRTRHDMKYLLRTLGSLVSGGQTDAALELIRQESGRLELAGQHDHCKEPFLNGLLQYYEEKMRSAGISFQTNIRIDTPPIPASELLILAGNLLENALEACKECGEQPFVKFNAGVVNSMLVFYMENTCSEVLYESRLAPESKQAAGQWLSAKEFRTKKRGGGTGLRSIEQIAQNHSGTAEYRLEEGKFVSRVILQTAQP